MNKGLVKNLTRGVVILLAFILVAGCLGSAFGIQGAGSPFTDVTGKMDLSDLMERYFNNSVLNSSEVKKYEERTVIVSLSDGSLMDLAGDMDISSYATSPEGQLKKKEIYAAQDELLERIKASGIECELKYRYAAVDNAIAITVNTKHVSEIKKLSGVSNVVISRSYTAPQSVTGTSSGDAVENVTNVYGTGIYDSSGALKDGLDGSGMVVAIIDTGLDYTHSAFSKIPDASKVALDYNKIASILASKALCAEDRQQLTSGKLNASDVYINLKVPFVYDYADNDADVYPSYSNHGTHVAGIVAGYDPNGYTDKDGNHVDDVFIGVAPEAQLVICKVFTDDLEDSELGGAVTEDILAALEDCIMLGVDVINMSLGTTCGFTSSDDGDDEGEYLNRIYKQIGDEGINLLCAASNDYSSAYGGVFGTNLSSNPDSGTVGSPATYGSALAVASISGKKSSYFIGNNTLPVFFEDSNDENNNPLDFIAQMLGDKTSDTLEYVVIPGVGLASDYTASVQKLVKGRIALVKRGDSTFKEKVEIAMSFGAIGIIVYNNVSGTVRMSLGEVTDPIPAISISLSSGEALRKAATSYTSSELAAGAVNRVGTISLNKSYKAGPFMSDFSSWGCTPDLKLKPEITAHGGEITSTVPGGYTEMSGTSMACPNMAGVVTLLRSYVKNKWPELSNVEVARRVNQLLMSTATTVYDREGLPYSPRKQGAGLGSLDNSRTTLAYLWVDNASNDYRPKIELGDDKDKKGVYTFTFCITNFGDTALSFKLNSLFMTETLGIDGLTVAEQAYMLDDMGAVWSIGGTEYADGDTVTVEANADSYTEITLTLKLSDAEKKYIDASFENGMFVEGFAKLESATDGQCDLVLPFMGFYGDWSAAPMLDYDAYELAGYQQDSSILDDEKPQASVWATQPYLTYYNDEYIIPMGSFLYLQDENATNQIYASEEHNAISGFNNYYGEDNAENYLTSYKFKGLYAGLLRNARKVDYELVNADTGEVLDSQTSYRIGKAYADGGSAHPAYVELFIDPVELNMASGDHYTMNFEFFLDYEDGSCTKNTFSFSFYVDYEAPILQDVRVRYYNYKDGNKTKQRIYLDMDIFDNHYAQSAMLTYLDDGELKLATEYVTPVYNANKNGTTTVSIEITDIYDKYKDSLYVQIDDYALNHSIYWLNLSKCNTVVAPDYFELADGEATLELDIYETHTVKLNYDGDANISNFQWTSNNRSVADVKNGEIVGLAPGKATITVTGSGGTRATIEVTVTDKVNKLPVPSISFGPIQDGEEKLTKAQSSVEMYPGMTFKLDVLTDPWYYPTDQLTLKWESTNPSVATVDQDGNVVLLEKGTAVIMASIMSNGVQTAYSATVTLKVLDPFVVSNYSLVAYHGVGGVVRIPTDKNIMMIGEEAFKDNDNITEIIIPKTVTSIGKNAFENCTALKRVYFVDTEEQEIADADISIIYQRAFYGCKELELVDFSNVKVVTLGRECFAGCTKLSEVRKMTKVGTVFANAFADCKSLTSLDLTGLRVCGSGAFSGCTALKSVKTGSFTRLGDYAFSGCTGLNEIEISASTVGAYAFYGCSNLQKVYFAPESGKDELSVTIGDHAFEGCSSLHLLNITELTKVLSIGDYAFANTALTRFTVPNGLNILGENILFGTSITELTIGDSFDFANIRLMGIPFANINIKLETGCTKYVIENGVLYNAAKTKLLLVLPKTSSVSIPSTVTDIGDYAFAGSTVTSITIPAGVKTLGKYVFANSSLSEIVFESSSELVAIPDYAFYSSRLSAIILPSSVTSVGEYAFANTYLITVNFSSSALSSIGDGAFYGCTYLSAAILPDGASVMGSNVFRECGSLVTAVMPSVTELGDYTFVGCGLLKNVNFGANTKTLGDNTFYLCTSLKSVSFGDQLLAVGKNTFYGCSGLESINLKNIKTIGEYAFAECTALSEVIGLGNVRVIGDGAFYNANGLRELILTSAETIGEGAFAIENGGNAYTVVYIPAAVEIGPMAFLGGKESTVTIPASLVTLGDGAFASSKKLTTFDCNNSKFFVRDDVLYRVISDGKYELCAFPGGKALNGGEYTVLDGTIRVASYAFYGLGKNGPSSVVLPWSLDTIGVSAFFDSGIHEYNFKSIKAPTLSTVYRQDVIDMMEAAVENKTADSVAVKGLFYANFDTLMVRYTEIIGEKSPLIMHCPENGDGYDNYVYSTYFGTVSSLGVLMDDTTRSAIEAIEALEPAEELKNWLGLEVNDVNRAKLDDLIARVKEARRLYNNISGDAQLAFVSAENTAKLTAIEAQVRALKTKFSIPLVISNIRYNDGYKKEYKEGEFFDLTGLVLTIVYDDGSTDAADLSKLTLTYPDGALTIYDAEVRFSYQYGDSAADSKTVRIPVTVTAAGTSDGANGGEDIGDDEKSDGIPKALVVVLIVIGGIAVVGGVAVAAVVLYRKKASSVSSDVSEKNVKISIKPLVDKIKGLPALLRPHLRWIVIGAAAVAAVAVIVVIAVNCDGGSENVLDSVDININYNANGGEFDNHRTEKTIGYKVGTFPLNIGKQNLTNGNANINTRDGYVFEGWYLPETDANGQLVYEDEARTIVKLGSPFDFTKRLEGEGDIQLYAKWSKAKYVPVILVGTSLKDASGNVYDEGSIIRELVFQNGSIEKFGGSRLVDNLTRGEYTFVEYYSDAQCTSPVSWPISETAGDSAPIYAKFIEGDWSIVSDKESALKMLRSLAANGKYFVIADIDLDGAEVTTASQMRATVIGNGFTLSNFSVVKKSVDSSGASLFGVAKEGSKFEGLKLQNVDLDVSLRSNVTAAVYFLFTSVEDGAEISKLSVTGKLSVNYKADTDTIISNLQGTDKYWIIGGDQSILADGNIEADVSCFVNGESQS